MLTLSSLASMFYALTFLLTLLNDPLAVPGRGGTSVST
jgi:hypothetical protein